MDLDVIIIVLMVIFVFMFFAVALNVEEDLLRKGIIDSGSPVQMNDHEDHSLGNGSSVYGNPYYSYAGPYSGSSLTYGF